MNQEKADALNQAIRLLCLRHRAMVSDILAPMGLFPGQEAFLLELARAGPTIQVKLSEALGCEPPSVTLMASKLEKRGYITRSPVASDKRVSIVEITSSGRQVAELIKARTGALAQDMVAGLPDATADELVNLLQRLADRLAARRPKHRLVVPGALD